MAREASVDRHNTARKWDQTGSGQKKKEKQWKQFQKETIAAICGAVL